MTRELQKAVTSFERFQKQFGGVNIFTLSVVSVDIITWHKHWNVSAYFDWMQQTRIFLCSLNHTVDRWKQGVLSNKKLDWQFTDYRLWLDSSSVAHLLTLSSCTISTALLVWTWEWLAMVVERYWWVLIAGITLVHFFSKFFKLCSECIV